MKKKLILLCFVLLPAVYACAAIDNKGTDFWICFPATNHLSGGGVKTLNITGNTATTGNISIPGLGYTQDFTVTPGVMTSITLPLAAEPLDTVGESITNVGIHVTSADSIAVYGLSWLLAIADAYLALPVPSLGNEYIAATYKNSPGLPGSEFAVTACQDNTTLTITPSTATGGHAAGVQYNIVLNQGQVYQLLNGDASGDLTGSIVLSDKPVAFFGAHRCVLIPQNIQTCDYIVEQIPPVPSWGTEFVSIPLQGRMNGDTYRIVGSQDNTSVYINGVLVSLNRTQFYENIYSVPLHITSDKPVMVMQYANGSQYDGQLGDPFMMYIPPIEQYLNSYTVINPDINFTLNYLNLLVPDSETSAVNLDGTNVPASSFFPVGATGYSGAQIPVNIGTHNVSSLLPFGIFIYGWGDYISYGYTGGMSLSDLQKTATVTPTITPTWTFSATASSTPSRTPTFTITQTHTSTYTPTYTQTATPTTTPTFTPTCTNTPVPFVFIIKGAFPNPSVYNSHIVYYLSRDAHVTMQVFDVSGEKVRFNEMEGYGGYNEWFWDASNHAVKPVASGVFIIKGTAVDPIYGGKYIDWCKAAITK